MFCGPRNSFPASAVRDPAQLQWEFPGRADLPQRPGARQTCPAARFLPAAALLILPASLPELLSLKDRAGLSKDTAFSRVSLPLLSRRSAEPVQTTPRSLRLAGHSTGCQRSQHTAMGSLGSAGPRTRSSRRLGATPAALWPSRPQAPRAGGSAQAPPASCARLTLRLSPRGTLRREAPVTGTQLPSAPRRRSPRRLQPLAIPLLCFWRTRGRRFPGQGDSLPRGRPAATVTPSAAAPSVAFSPDAFRSPFPLSRFRFAKHGRILAALSLSLVIGKLFSGHPAAAGHGPPASSRGARGMGRRRPPAGPGPVSADVGGRGLRHFLSCL